MHTRHNRSNRSNHPTDTGSAGGSANFNMAINQTLPIHSQYKLYTTIDTYYWNSNRSMAARVGSIVDRKLRKVRVLVWVRRDCLQLGWKEQPFTELICKHPWIGNPPPPRSSLYLYIKQDKTTAM